MHTAKISISSVEHQTKLASRKPVIRKIITCSPGIILSLASHYLSEQHMGKQTSLGQQQSQLFEYGGGHMNSPHHLNFYVYVIFITFLC